MAQKLRARADKVDYRLDWPADGISATDWGERRLRKIAAFLAAFKLAYSFDTLLKWGFDRKAQ
jgi:hypothetical protein